VALGAKCREGNDFMSEQGYEAALEAVLYSAGEDGMTLPDLASTLNIAVPAMREQITQWGQKLQSASDRGVYLAHFGERYKLVTKPLFADMIRNYLVDAGSRHLSQAAVEVVSIVAYQQPITRIEIDEIRGIHSAGALQTLLAHDLIAEAGRKDAPGRPILYQTTPAFLDYFGLTALSDLPPLTRSRADIGESSDLFATFNAELGDTDESASADSEKE
jgi:segregation and condensation protein B